MIGTVDFVIAGDASGARAAAVSALQRGQRVLVVLRSADARVARCFRRSLLETAGADGGQLSVMTSAEVVCADGVDGVEAVVVRHAPTGRLSAVNASAFISFDAASQSRRPRGRHGTNRAHESRVSRKAR
jgi:hypothetical protein